MSNDIRGPDDLIKGIKQGQRFNGYFDCLEDLQTFLKSEKKVSRKKLINYLKHLISIKSL